MNQDVIREVDMIDALSEHRPHTRAEAAALIAEYRQAVTTGNALAEAVAYYRMMRGLVAVCALPTSRRTRVSEVQA